MEVDMEIDFKNEKLRKQCNDDKEMAKVHGQRA
jgi:hypothetical protein